MEDMCPFGRVICQPWLMSGFRQDVVTRSELSLRLCQEEIELMQVEGPAICRTFFLR